MQSTFNRTEISQAFERITLLGCHLRVEGDTVLLTPPKGLTVIEMEEIKGLCQRYKPGLLALLQGRRVNGFTESIEKSDSPTAHAFLEAVYRKAFYNFDGVLRSKSGSTGAQKLGADVVIWTTAGRSYTADEKIRPSRHDYKDIALEYTSSDKRDTPGWIEKDLGIDYLVYAFVPIRRAYLFPWQQLKAAWNKNKVNWLKLANEKRDGFMVVSSPNPTYNTLSCAVPTELLIAEVQKTLTVQL